MKIQSLHIYSADIVQQNYFYKNILELPVHPISEHKIEVMVGYSKLIIEQREKAKPYHIAFHISAYQENKALHWLKERCTLLTLNQEEIIDFSSWHAKSLYFYDADKNIIEFIARRTMNKSDSVNFSAQELWGIAEIGLAVKDVKNTFNQINTNTGLQQFGGDLEKFCPIGTHSGLLITVDQNQKTWFPTQDKSEPAAFKLVFRYADKTRALAYNGSEIKISEA